MEEYVVKVGRWGPDVHRCHGPHQNHFEARMYDIHNISASREGGDLLLPVIASSKEYEWIIQPYVVTLKEAFGCIEEVYDEDHPIRSELWNSATPLRDFASTEGCLPHNIGRWKREWYILDYARPRHDHSVEDINAVEGEATNPIDVA